MFVVNELEKILHTLAEAPRGRNPETRFSLPDVKRIAVKQLGLADKVRMQPIRIKEELIDTQNRLHEELFKWNDKELTTDKLFCTLMKSILLDNLKKLPPRAYPAARLMICDQLSLDLLTKFQFLCQNEPPFESSYIIYGQPYNVVAVLLLDDIVDQIDRLERPIVKFGSDPATGKQTAQFDYSIIKQVLPYLKISDLVIVLHQLGDLKLGKFTIDGRREHQLIQMLTHFAASSMLLELRDIDRQLGQQHLLFDNVTAFLPHNNEALFDSMKSLEKQAAVLDTDAVNKFNYHIVPPFTHLTLIAYRLVRLALQLGWSLESITFRQGDPTGFTKLFSHILDSVIKYDKGGTNTLGNKRLPVSHSIIPVRVLVLDRYIDLHGLLKHSTRYGAYLDQELRSSASDFLATRQINTIDKLDTQLCFEDIEDVLTSLLKSSVQTQSITDGSAQAFRDNQAVQKHLTVVKQMYKIMTEGYLLMRKLESSIERISQKLGSLTEQLSDREQNDMLERIKRIDLAYRQLLSVNSAAIRLSDALRFACLLIDLINMFIQIQPNEQTRAKLFELKVSIVLGKELLNNLMSLVASRGSDLHAQDTTSNDDMKQVSNEIAGKLEEFDKISSRYCSTRSFLSLEEVIEKFYTRKLDASAYPTQKLMSASVSGFIRGNLRNKIVVVFLGSMSYDELHRMKLLERKLVQPKHGATRRHSSTTFANEYSSSSERLNDILTIACGFIRPNEFIHSL